MPNSRVLTPGGHRALRVWQEARLLAHDLGAVVDALVRERRWHLADQLARAATSVHANIAEGSGRRTRRDFAGFATIAWASLREVESLLEEVLDADPTLRSVAAPCLPRIRNTTRLLAGLLRALRRPDP
jgi:four helix bundle protein